MGTLKQENGSEIRHIAVETAEPVILQCTDIVYEEKPYWCNATRYPLKMSILHPRTFFDYDRKPGPLPCILFLAGGGWTEVDQNVWLPELTYYAKRGYIIASVSYSLPATWFFPEMLIDIKAAVRYLKSHCQEWNIDPENIFVMGESAGGHLAALVAVTGHRSEFDRGENLDVSSCVRGAVLFYPAVDMLHFGNPDLLDPMKGYAQTLYRGKLEPQSLAAGVPYLRDEEGLGKTMDPRTYIDRNTPPTLIFHGTEDTQVPVSHSRIFYEALKKQGVETILYLVDGVDHADAAFVQTSIKDTVVDFLNNHTK